MTVETITVGTTKYQYAIHVPSNIPANPDVVIALHGGGSNGVEMYKRNWARQANKGFLIACPTARSSKPSKAEDHWVGLGDEKYGPDLDVHAHERFINKLIDELKDEYDIENVYVCGFSSGAKMAFHMACHNAGFIRGFGMTGHGINDELAEAGYSYSTPTRFSIGTADKNFHDPEVGWDALSTFDWLKEQTYVEAGSKTRTVFTGRKTKSVNLTYSYKSYAGFNALQVAQLKGMPHHWAKVSAGDPYFEDDALVKFWQDYADMQRF